MRVGLGWPRNAGVEKIRALEALAAASPEAPAEASRRKPINSLYFWASSVGLSRLLSSGHGLDRVGQNGPQVTGEGRENVHR